MTEKYEFMSSGWLNKMKEILSGLVEKTKAELSGVTFSLNEVFTNPPDHIVKEYPGDTASYYFRIANGELEFGKGEISNANIKIKAPYETIKPIAMTLKADDPTYDERIMKIFSDGAQDGTAGFYSDIKEGLKVLPEAFDELHDLIARHTV